MSLLVTQNGKTSYLINLHYPEITWLRETARAMNIPTDAVLAAAIGHGLAHYTGMVSQIINTNKRQDDNERESDNGKETESKRVGS